MLCLHRKLNKLVLRNSREVNRHIRLPQTVGTRLMQENRMALCSHPVLLVMTVRFSDYEVSIAEGHSASLRSSSVRKVFARSPKALATMGTL